VLIPHARSDLEVQIGTKLARTEGAEVVASQWAISDEELDHQAALESPDATGLEVRPRWVLCFDVQEDTEGLSWARHIRG
jgi:hypothetical protein